MVIINMQIKTIMSYYIFIRMAERRENPVIIKTGVCVCVCVCKPRTLYRGGRNELVESFWKTVWWFLIKVNMHLLKGSAISLLGINQRRMKIHGHRKTSICVFTATLFIITKKLELTQMSVNIHFMDK